MHIQLKKGRIWSRVIIAGCTQSVSMLWLQKLLNRKKNFAQGQNEIQEAFNVTIVSGA